MMQTATEDVWSISRLNQVVRNTLQNERSLQNIWVEGEVYNLTYHSSGHIYFSLKDDQSSVNCTFFKTANASFRDIKLKEGMQVLVKGGISVYLVRGTYQFNVSRVMLSGEGDLRLRIEQLKKKLHAEGLFATEKKKRLPVVPLTLGVATAPTGAAIQDIIRVARNRFANINILLAPCLVQGEEAPGSIVEAIEALNRPEFGVDVIIAGRGGGSFEDLLAFNDEAVVRAYHASRIPIVSAVGHEIDTPLTDFAADASAPTPSAAAEMVVPVINNVLGRIDECTERLYLSLLNRKKNETVRLKRIFLSRVYENPGSILESHQLTLDLLSKELKQKMTERLRQAREQTLYSDAIPALYEKRLSILEKRCAIALERLSNFSPLATLKRGYSIVRKPDSNVVLRDAAQTSPGEELEILLHRGRVTVRVESTDTETAR